MCNFSENTRSILEIEFGIGVAKGHDVVGHHHNLFNFPQADKIISQYVHKVQPPCAEHVVREDTVLLREVPEA